MTQTRQGVLSTKGKATQPNPTHAVFPISSDIPATKSNKLFVVVEPVSKLYTDDICQFTIRSHSDHCYIMLAFYCKSNAILIEPFQSHHDRHRIADYSRIMRRLCERGQAMELQVLDNKASKEYCLVITQIWKATLQLAPSYVHHCNAAERSI